MGVLIWINGAFGSGKTQTAHELQRRVGSAHVADPELLGFALHKMLPAHERTDFQDYFDEIVGGLRERDVDVRHYTLSASAQTGVDRG